MKINVAIIGYGRMGRFYQEELSRSGRFQLSYICDIDEESRNLAAQRVPQAKVTARAEDIYEDDAVQLVILSATADTRLQRIEQAFAAGKHVIAEKPIADSVDHEWEAVKLAEQASAFSAVDLYLRNSWYHNLMKDFICSGEIGDLAILRVCHMTPGLAPGEGHEKEGPSFHDCGMHYVDLTRWYAQSEYKTWHAQAVRMWDYKDPWWLQVHGTFENGVVYDITQGFVYGQLSKDQTHNSYVDIIGSKGICRMTHDFRTAKVELRGVGQTIIKEEPYGGKNLDKLLALMADSIETGERRQELPSFRDSALASAFAYTCLADSRTHDLPATGTADELRQIILRRSQMENGYGLLPKNHRKKV